MTIVGLGGGHGPRAGQRTPQMLRAKFIVCFEGKDGLKEGGQRQDSTPGEPITELAILLADECGWTFVTRMAAIECINVVSPQLTSTTTCMVKSLSNRC